MKAGCSYLGFRPNRRFTWARCGPDSTTALERSATELGTRCSLPSGPTAKIGLCLASLVTNIDQFWLAFRHTMLDIGQFGPTSSNSARC